MSDERNNLDNEGEFMTSRSRESGNPSRESQIMVLAAEGLTDKQISSQLGISPDTVSTYWRRILSRYNAASRTEVVAKMVRQQTELKLAEANRTNTALRKEIEQRQNAEDQLELTYTRLNAIANEATDAILLENHERRVIYINRAFREMFGVADLIGISIPTMNIQYASGFADPYRYLERIDEILAAGKEVIGDRLELLSGSVILRNYKPIVTESGTIGHAWFLRDITQSVLDENNLSKKSSLSTLFARIAPLFVRALTPEDRVAALNQALTTLGVFAEVERTYIFQYYEEESAMAKTHEWQSPTYNIERTQLGKIPIDKFSWWFTRTLNNQITQVKDLADLPLEANTERILLEGRKIKSLITVPITGSDGKVLGYLGMDAVHKSIDWEQGTVDLLIHLVNLLAAMFERYPDTREISLGY